MATQKTKNHYYVLVITESGPIFVTGTGTGHTAFWNKTETPTEFSKKFAEDMTFGLNLNFHLAYLITSAYEIVNQPYNYKDYKFKAERKETEKC